MQKRSIKINYEGRTYKDLDEIVLVGPKISKDTYECYFYSRFYKEICNCHIDELNSFNLCSREVFKNKLEDFYDEINDKKEELLDLLFEFDRDLKEL